MFFAVIMCLGFVGCKEERGSLPEETEKITPRVEETIPPEKITPRVEETIPPMEIPPAPAERQPQGEQEGGGDVSHDNP
jgi:hypothetical protein